MKSILVLGGTGLTFTPKEPKDFTSTDITAASHGAWPIIMKPYELPYEIEERIRYDV